MNSSFPFFYYDILARIVPGAATLAVLWPTTWFPPMNWLRSFVVAGGHEQWENLAVPILFLGLCYVIGVVYEVLDYFPDAQWIPRWFPSMKWVTEWVDDEALRWSVRRFGDENEKAWSAKANREQIAALRRVLWDRIMFIGGSEPKMNPVFAHCHRFQAEEKMFLHLLYPTLLFEIISYREWLASDQGFFGIVGLVLFAFCFQARSRRRWMQTLAFSRIIRSPQGCVQGASGFQTSETKTESLEHISSDCP